jgi:hypothetical protein
MAYAHLMNGKGLIRIFAAVCLAITLVILVPRLFRPTGLRKVAFAAPGKHLTYTTHFPLTENPVSEGAKWANGQTDALDWANVRTVLGLAFGTETAKVTTAPGKYDDSTALLTGDWGPDQTAEATVHSVNQNDTVYEEVELRLRSTLTPHRATGYEICFRCSKTAKAYTQIVKWNGPLGDFSYVKIVQGSQYGVANGDVVKATIRGNAITVYVDGARVLQVNDDTFKSGNPGMGFYIEGTTGVNRDYGFTSFSATDQ